MSEANLDGIAIIGLTGRFPGAASVDDFWRNLVAGAESISTFSDEELRASGYDTAALRADSNYVPARGILRDAEMFDAAFFGMNPKEAEITDPQQRVFLEAAWQALENAGYDPERPPGAIGIYAGMSNNSYYVNNLLSRRDLTNSVGWLVTMMGNEKDYLATRVAYKLNFKGPAINVYTACSTSLVAVCQACQSLLNYQCDLALAGGASITFPQKRGYFFEEGGITSPDGHCRAFDVNAAGTVFSHGLGIVVLKRASEALADGDQIYAVIKGYGLNNDGSSKVSFSAPSVDGHAEVIALAQGLAGFDPATISYIETHGTGTPLGDPIEIAGLTQAFRAHTEAKQFCAIGSVKTNVGHLDVAAGVTGLIKTALAFKHKLLPASLHFTEPNPKIDFANSPFFVNDKLTEWKTNGGPRRAGVSSFGVGGTNSHIVLEESPAREASDTARPVQLLVLSAKCAAALEDATANLLAHLKSNPEINLADAAFTLQVGRSAFNHRRILACRDVDDAIAALQSRDAKRIFSQSDAQRDPPIVFMFPGQGAQQVDMARELYETERVFREEVDSCAEILRPHLGLDLREIIFLKESALEEAKKQLGETRFTQPSLFVIEYALAKLWMSWGIRPQAMIGHSVGEYVAGCLSGVFALEDALMLVARRAALVQAQPRGSMLAVKLPLASLQPLLPAELSVAAVNSPTLCVVSGADEVIEQFEKQLAEKKITARHLCTSHAFHSAMMDPVLEPYTKLVTSVKLNPPQIPFVSNVTAQWITAEQATDPRYWSSHLRQTVHFAGGVAELAKDPARILLEVGPGQSLSTMARQIGDRKTMPLSLPSLPASADRRDLTAMLTTLGRLWLAGVSVDWTKFYADERRHRIPLPTYPFQRQRYFADPAPGAERGAPRDDRPLIHLSCDALASATSHAARNGSPAPAPTLASDRSETNSATPSVEQNGASGAAIAPESALERIMKEQLEVMSKQLQMLREGGFDK